MASTHSTECFFFVSEADEVRAGLARDSLLARHPARVAQPPPSGGRLGLKLHVLEPKRLRMVVLVVVAAAVVVVADAAVVC